MISASLSKKNESMFSQKIRFTLPHAVFWSCEIVCKRCGPTYFIPVVMANQIKSLSQSDNLSCGTWAFFSYFSGIHSYENVFFSKLSVSYSRTSFIYEHPQHRFYYFCWYERGFFLSPLLFVNIIDNITIFIAAHKR